MAAERAQARQLASTAAQAVILGDLDRARSLLDRATQLDRSSADLAYRHARVLQDLGDRPAAISEFCRVLAVDPLADGVEDARDHLETLLATDRVEVPATAIAAFEEGLRQADTGLLEDAAASFDTVAAIVPDWPEGLFDRGVILARLGRTDEATRDLRRYLDLRPNAPDAIAVSQRIGELQNVALVRTPSPGTALVLGVLIPGMGQFYSGRALGGLTVLSLAGAAIATGYFIKDVKVICLSEPGPDGVCPVGDVLREKTERPYMVAGLGAAAAIGVIGAIEALVHARGMGSAGEEVASIDLGRATLGALGVAPSRGRIDLRLVRLAF